MGEREEFPPSGGDYQEGLPRMRRNQLMALGRVSLESGDLAAPSSWSGGQGGSTGSMQSLGGAVEEGFSGKVVSAKQLETGGGKG